MLRREFLAALPSAALSPAFARAQVGARAKITDIKLMQVRKVRDLGQFDNTDFIPNMRPTYAVGGMTITQIFTDQEMIGIGPGTDPGSLAAAKAILVGADPFEIERLVPRLYGRGGSARGPASVEIALWDLIGKLANQPLYKLWGGAKDEITPYCSLMTTGSPAERAERAVRMKGQGWRGMKLRTSFPTFRQDVEVVEAVRSAVGDDFIILCDANKAYGNLHMWDVRRATDTARAYQDLGVYWLEEPLPQYALSQLTELNGNLEMPLAGAEGTNIFHDFVDLIDRGCYDVLNCEVMATGPQMTRRVQAYAQPKGISVVPHLGDGLLGTICQHHLVASWTNASLAELVHEPPVADFEAQWEVFETPPRLAQTGTIAMSQAPGLGVAIKPDLLVPV